MLKKKNDYCSFNSFITADEKLTERIASIENSQLNSSIKSKHSRLLFPTTFNILLTNSEVHVGLRCMATHSRQQCHKGKGWSGAENLSAYGGSPNSALHAFLINCSWGTHIGEEEKKEGKTTGMIPVCLF